MQNVLQWPNSNFSGRTIYEQIVKAVIYPNYDLSTFQTNKPTNNIWNEMDYWFHHNFTGTKPYQVWESGIDYLLDNLSQEFVEHVHGVAKNIMIFDSPLYCFGDSNIKTPDLPYNAKQTVKNLIADPAKQHRHIINSRLVIY
jgi:hypothetical protein